MTREPLDRLRRADPVPQPVGYSGREQADHVADILERDGRQVVAVVDTGTRQRSRPRYLAVAVAVAAVLLLAIGSAVLATRHTGNGPAASTGRVTCTVATDGGTKAVRARLTRAEQVIRQRIDRLGGSAHSFSLSRTEGRIGFTPQGTSIGHAEQACRASSVEIRPVIARPATVDVRASRSSAALSDLAFAVPSSEAGYQRLTVPQRSALAAAMSRYDCSPLPGAAAVGLACDDGPGDADQVLLVGSPVVRGSDVRTADAVAPGTEPDAYAEWTVGLSLDAAGAARLRAFTGAHHNGNSSATLAGCGGQGHAECSDFLAFTVDGHVASVPLTTSVLESTVSISGALTRSSAQTMADDLTAASVQLHAD